MFKILILILLLGIFPAFIYSQINIENNSLKDKIKIQKIREINTYKAIKINTPTESYEIEFHYSFDSLGNMIEKSSYYNGIVIQKELFNYDRKGNMLDENWYNADNSIIYSSFTVYDFDKKGNPVAKNIYNSDSSIRKSVLNLYDTNGLLQESNVKENFEAGEEYKEIFSYDSKGKIVNHKINSKEGIETLNENITYDDNGNILSVNSEGNGEAKALSFEYDNNKNLIHFISIYNDDEGKDYIEGEYNYDDKGILNEELIYDENKMLTDKRKFEIIF